MEGDIAEMGKFIGAGLATIGLGGAGIGVGDRVGLFLRNDCAYLEAMIAAFSASEPSHQWTRAGFVSAAICSTQAISPW